MKIITYNCNGLRAILSKDKTGKRDTDNPNTLQSLIKEEKPDIICLQETKCPEDLQTSIPFSFHKIISSKTRKGYSGVAVYSNIPPMNTLEDFPDNKEGRVLCLEFDKFFLLNTYTPNSKADLSRLDYRVNVWEPAIRKYINDLQKTKPVVFASDFNVAPTELDIHTVKGHARSHGFTIEERTAFAALLSESKLVDAYRVLHPHTKKYTWFSNFGKAKENNKGWRIDTFLVSSKLQNSIKRIDIMDQYLSSDHRPVLLEIDL
jgi:exodeoxyribonuclease III